MRTKKACGKMAQPAADDLPLAPPAQLTASVLEIGGDEFALLEWPVEKASVPAGLSRAEREIAELVLAGLSNAEIARRRGRSIRTVANQVAGLLRKLGVQSRLELFARARSTR